MLALDWLTQFIILFVDVTGNLATEAATVHPFW
jgi:hypothetical protein